MASLLALVLAVTFLILLSLLLLYFEVRSLRSDIVAAIKSLPRELARRPAGAAAESHHHRGPLGYFVVWEWDEGEWRAKTEDLPPGANPGLPPSYPGAMRGYHAKTWVSKEQK
jgi:hypothetical protein